MTKDRYKEIRKRDNFLFTYYLEQGGYIKNPQQFENNFIAWLMLKKGLTEKSGKIKITQFLDKKYQYVR